MASETSIGQLVINLRLKTEALEKGLETAKKKLQEIEQNNKQIENSNKRLDASYLAMSATAVVALAKIGSAIKDCVNEYNSYTQAMSSLQNVSEYTGESMQDFSEIMKRFGTYMTKADLATTIKNFSLMGMSAKQTEQMIEELTNSAIRNRNANYTVSEAVRVASEGYRQGLSTLSDSAGVTENLSVQLDMYAQSIGKTASQLTDAEKNQAYLNRTMYAAEPFAGAMESYLDSLAGKQGQYSQAMRETQVAYTEAIEPLLIKFEEFKIKTVSVLGDIISSNKSATVGITTFGVAVLSLGTILIVGIKAVQMYKTAIDALNISSKALKNTMSGMIVFSTIIAGITALTTAIKENEEATAKLEEITKRYDEVKNGTFEYTDKNVASLESDKQKIEEQIELYKKLGEAQKQYDELSELQKGNYWIEFTKGIEQSEDGTISFTKSAYELKEEIKDCKKAFEEAQKTNGNYGNSLEELEESQENNTEALKKANAVKKINEALDIESKKTKQKEAAQLKVNANQMQKYLDVVKKGDKSTSEYQDAVKELTDAYSEASTAEGINVKTAQDCINADKARADQAWNTSQLTIQGNIDVINTYLEMARQAENDKGKQEELANKIGMSYENIIPTLTSVLNVLQLIGGYKPEEVPNIKPTSTYTPKKSNSSGSYQNKALDNYKKQIEYKKSLDQISLRDEINMYETALRRYAKTQDEKMELTTKIYELRKELAEQTLDDYISQIEYGKNMGYISTKQEIERYEYAYKNYAKTTEQKRDLEVTLHDLREELEEETIQMLKEQADKERELLNQKTEDYNNYIQEKKNLRGVEYDVKEQEADLNKIIEIHRNYLNQIMKDERYSLEERESIYREELDIIKDYEQQKRDARVSSVNDTVNQLKSAITKQIEEMQKADEEAIQKNIKLVEEWKDTRIDAINEEYNARIQAIQDELDALNKSEEEKTRAEEDAEYERKKNRLEQLIAYEHDATTKANYQKELDKLVADYKKTIDKRALNDKKEALKEQQDLLKEEQSSKTDAIKEEAEQRKEQYQVQLDNLKEYYDKQKEMAQETAEKMLLNVEQNQNQILNLLNKYGNKYEITGQSLGEKLAQGINKGIADKIQNIIQRIQDTIDTGIENKIKEWTSGMYKYEAGASKPQSKTINVTQQNYIQQNPEMPSETYRKLNNISQKLAEEFAGM